MTPHGQNLGIPREGFVAPLGFWLAAQLAAYPGPPPAGRVSAAVVRHGRIQRFTLRPDGYPLPNLSSDARFPAYSITKSFMAAAAFRLSEAGALDLDAAVSALLPDVPHATSYTARQLMAHTSGLPDYGGLPAYGHAVRTGAPVWPPSRFFAETGAGRLLFQPGVGWAYSNIGYMVLKMLLEAAGGGPFADVMREQVFAPLGLRDTYIVGDEGLEALAFGPSPWLCEPCAAGVARKYRPGWVASGLAASTASDVAWFYHALFTGGLLSPGSLDAMCQARQFEHIPGRPYARPGYALGLQVDAGFSAGPIFGHTGAGPGASACCFHAPHDPEPLTVALFMEGEAYVLAEELTLAALAQAAAHA